MSEEKVELKSKKREKRKIKYPLPNAQLTLDTQLEVLGGYVAASEKGSKSVGYAEVARFVPISKCRVSSCNKFFESVGLLKSVKGQRGKYMPSNEVIDWKNKYQWDSESAKLILKPLFEETWFAKLTKKSLEVKPKMSEEKLFHKLGEEAEASPQDETALRQLIEYMATFKVVEKDEKQNISMSEERIPKVEEGEKEVKIEKEYKKPIQVNIFLGINVSPEMPEEEIRKAVKIILDEIKKESIENE